MSIRIRSSIYEKVMDELCRWGREQPYGRGEARLIVVDVEHWHDLMRECYQDVFGPYVELPMKAGDPSLKIHGVPVIAEFDVEPGVLQIEVRG